MAIDEALLESCARGDPGFPCLRLYGFAPACLSLGFSQETARCVDLEFCRRSGIEVVRRPTGGRAVLHDIEVTYAVVARAGAHPFDGTVLESYEAIARGLLAGFRRVGVSAAVSDEAKPAGGPGGGAVCFAEPTRHEIAAGAYKIAGSAQARRRGSLLQHGSVPIRIEIERLAGASATRAADLPEMRGLSQVLGLDLDPAVLKRALVDGFEEAFGAALAPGTLTDVEAERAERLRAWRYLTTSWTFRR